MAKQKKAVPGKRSGSALTITRQESLKLSPSQLAFNRLTARIEKLRSEIGKKEKQLDEALVLYGSAIPPLSATLIAQQRQLLSLLGPFYRQKKLPKGQQSHLRSLLQDYLEEVVRNQAGEPDEELKELFRELEGETYEAVRAREQKEAQAEMQELFDRWGIESEDTDTVTDEETMARKMAALQEKMQEQQAAAEQKAEARQKARPKTAKQVEQEKVQQAAAALQHKNINTIYRQLAKLFHPDLEQNEDRRLEKEVLMKQLTEAYEARNLHALLMLELKWIHNENNHLGTLTEEKLAVYLQILRQQAIELENEKWQLLHRPRYYALVEKYGVRPLTFPVKTVREDVARMEHFKAVFEKDIEAMQGPEALKYLKTMLKEWKTEQQYADDSLFNLMQSIISTQGRW